MKVRVLDRRGQKLEVRIEDEEDLWTLRIVLRPGDLITTRTFRDVSIKGSETKERRPITVTLRLKNVEFQPFTGKLRAYGVIVEGPEEYGLKGKHHAAMISIGQSIVLEREGGWPKEIVKRMEESGPKGKALIVAVDYDEYAVALVAHHGYRILLEREISLPGKDDPSRESMLSSYVAELVRSVVSLGKREGTKLVVVVGPGPLKEVVARKIRELSPDMITNTDSTSMGGRAGVEEALRRPKVYEILRDYSIVEAESWLETFLSLLARDRNRVAYTVDEVLKVAEMGAVERIVVVDELIYSMDDVEREKVDRTLSVAERARAKILIVPRDSPVGEKVWRLGGIIAVLRFPVPPEARS
jgi:protein pelota